MYYIGNIACVETDIRHFGIPGMKWGQRRYQNEDGTLTEAGKLRYKIVDGKIKKRSSRERGFWRALTRFKRKKRAGLCTN